MFYVVTGGSGSGKSEYAENLIDKWQKKSRYYIATMQVFDEESRKRVSKHQQMRAGRRFVTIECHRNLQDLCMPRNGVVLLECMSNLVANEMFADSTGKAKIKDVEMEHAALVLESRAEQLKDKVMQGIKSLKKQASHLVVVTNEIFSDGIQYGLWTQAYQKCLAAINREMAEQADHVVEVVYGHACTVK